MLPNKSSLLLIRSSRLRATAAFSSQGGDAGRGPSRITRNGADSPTSYNNIDSNRSRPSAFTSRVRSKRDEPQNRFSESRRNSRDSSSSGGGRYSTGLESERRMDYNERKNTNRNFEDPPSDDFSNSDYPSQRRFPQNQEYSRVSARSLYGRGDKVVRRISYIPWKLIALIH